MSLASVLAACRSELASLAKSIIRILFWVVLILVVFVLLPQAWVALVPQQAREFFGIQTSVAFGLIAVSLAAIWAIAKNRTPDGKTWIGTFAGIAAAGIAAVVWLPQWSGYIVASALVLFVVAPIMLFVLARRRQAAGYPNAAAFYARPAWVLHPSRHMRLEASFLAAQTLASIEEKIAAYRALLSDATPEQSVSLNSWIAMDQDDWESMLAQSRSAGDKPSALKSHEIRALGELGRVDEMIATYASAESVLSREGLLVCRLFVLAFGGRTDAVRSLLGSQFRSLSARNKAFWIFIAGRAAGKADEEARRVLMSYARAADDEAFRRRVQRHLNAAPPPGGAALSAQSRATIAAIEETLRKRNGAPR
jgi:hypothetical protein